MLDPNDYLLPPFEADLAAWANLLPTSYRLLRANCFSDFFIIDDAGAVHMLEIAAASISRISGSEGQFWLDLVHDQEGWLLEPLVDRCRDAGLTLQAGTCYGFRTLPFLGGKYEVENIFVASLAEWLPLMGDLYAKVKDLPDGTPVRIEVVD